MNTLASNNSDCCVQSQASNAIIGQIEFLFEGVFIIIVGTFGLFGNCTSVAVLSRKEMNNVFNHLLIFLSFIDSLLIIFAIINYSIVKAFGVQFKLYTYAFPYFVNPVSNIVLCASVFTVIAIASERFMAVCFPLKYRSMSCTQTVNQRVMKHIIPVIVISVLINTPKFFETELVEVPSGLSNATEVSFDITPLRENETYIYFYVHWGRLFGTGLIPMGVLIFLNTSIYIKIKASKKKLKSLGRRARKAASGNNNTNPPNEAARNLAQTPQEENNRNPFPSRRDIKMALVLSLIIILFFVCHLPRIILNLHEFIMLSDIRRCGKNFCPPTWFMCMVPINHFALVINSSVNILIYCSVGDNFMKRLRITKKKLNGNTPRTGPAQIRECDEPIPLGEIERAIVSANVIEA